MKVRWRDQPARLRCQTIGRLAGEIASHADQWMGHCQSPQRVDPVATITAELLPLSAAAKWIARRGPKVLKPRCHGWKDRPLWLGRVRPTIHRRPWGQVLILGSWNYPLFLPGVQTAQALAAGNRVLLKPAAGVETVTQRLAECFYRAGVPEQQLVLLDSATSAATNAIDQGVDLIVLTGSSGTGKSVLRRAAESCTPTILELSGCDATIVLPSADQKRVVDSLRFGLTFNGSATCIAPRRMFVEDSMADDLIAGLAGRLQQVPAIQVHAQSREAVAGEVAAAIASGAVDCTSRFDESKLRTRGEMEAVLLDRVEPDWPIAEADLFAPVLSVIRLSEIEAAIRHVNDCRYRLSAAVFGDSVAAQRVAQQLDVGSVTINDLIAPTADPRVPFGGRAASGFGVTRGAEGLLAMTVPQVISQRRGNFLPHLRDRGPADRSLLTGVLQLLYGDSLAQRRHAFGKMWRAVSEDRKHANSSRKEDSKTL